MAQDEVQFPSSMRKDVKFEISIPLFEVFERKVIWVRNFKSANHYQIGNHLAAMDRIGIMNSGKRTIEQLYESLLAVFQRTVEKYVPMRQLSSSLKRRLEKLDLAHLLGKYGFQLRSPMP